MRPLVAIDVDGVMLDFISKIVQQANTLLGDTYYEPKDVVEFDMYEALGLPQWCRDAIDASVDTPGFCASIEPYPGAVEGLAEIRKFADVVALTAPWDSDWWHREREKCLVEKLGFTRKQIAFADGELKQHFAADAFVDDKTSSVVQWKTRRAGTAILFTRPWNERDLYIEGYRATSWPNLVHTLRVAFGADDGTREEVAWLLEDSTGAFFEGQSMTRDPNVAIRFARLQDAERMLNAAKNVGVELVAREHMWVGGVSENVDG